MVHGRSVRVQGTKWKSESITDGRTNLLTKVGARDAYASKKIP